MKHGGWTRSFITDPETGRTFTTVKAMREYKKRALFDDWGTKAPVSECARIMSTANALTYKSVGKRQRVRLDAEPDPSGKIVGLMRRGCDPAREKSVVKSTTKAPVPSAGSRRILNQNGIWRMFIARTDGSWRWLADYATQEDALNRCNPIADREVSRKERANIINMVAK